MRRSTVSTWTRRGAGIHSYGTTASNARAIASTRRALSARLGQGALLKFIPIAEDYITNNAFGGPDMKTLYVTAGKTLYRVRTDIAGVSRDLQSPRKVNPFRSPHARGRACARRTGLVRQTGDADR